MRQSQIRVQHEIKLTKWNPGEGKLGKLGIAIPSCCGINIGSLVNISNPPGSLSTVDVEAPELLVGVKWMGNLIMMSLLQMGGKIAGSIFLLGG